MAASLGGAMGSMTDKKKMAIVGGLALVLVAVVAWRFFAPSGATESAGASGGVPSGMLDAKPEYMEAIARIARLRSEKAYDEENLRSPLDPLVKERRAPTHEPREEQDRTVSTDLPRMALHGIIWDPNNPIAIIDGLDLSVGDTIKGARVVEIRSDSVVLTYRSRRHVLTVD